MGGACGWGMWVGHVGGDMGGACGCDVHGTRTM